jgi:hypothetical protein
MSTNAFSQLRGREQAIRLHNGLLRMHPPRLKRIEPGTLLGEQERQDTHSLARPFDLLIVLAKPIPHQFADMPGSIVPDQQPIPFALSCQAFTTILQEPDRDRAHRSSCDKAQPDLRTVWVFWRPLLPQDAIASQGFGIGVALVPGVLHQTHRALFALPGMNARQGKTTPPHFVQEAGGPIWPLTGPGDQPIACVFFSRYCGSGLVIQCLARFQFVPNRLRARRTLSPETRVGVSPWVKLTWAASGRVHKLVWWPKSRGLRCKRSCSVSTASSVKVVRSRWGREEPSCNTRSPRALKPWITLRTVCLWQPNWLAIAGARSPRSEASTIWQRRKTKASFERNPAWTWWRSSSVKARMKRGVFMSSIIPHCRLPFVCMH